MKGFHLGAGLVYSAMLLIGPAVGLMTTPTSVPAGMGGTHLSAPRTHIGAAPAGVVQHIKEAAPAADNTGRNVRDRDGLTMTPSDQSNDPKDLKITRDIRKALVADDALSTTAKNIKIITVHGKVILRGPVANVQEKKKIAKMAQRFTKQRIENLLEVAAR
jgi:hyperosmotically inducible periplasmic protein